MQQVNIIPAVIIIDVIVVIVEFVICAALWTWYVGSCIFWRLEKCHYFMTRLEVASQLFGHFFVVNFAAFMWVYTILLFLLCHTREWRCRYLCKLHSLWNGQAHCQTRGSNSPRGRPSPCYDHQLTRGDRLDIHEPPDWEDVQPQNFTVHTAWKTLWRPLLQYGYSYKVSCTRPC